MRSFVLLACLATIAAVSAAPQFGYGYGAQPAASSFVPSTRGGEKYLPPATTTPAPSVHKQFYLISAPEDTEGAGKPKHLVIGRPQKNYRVVFIKAPNSDNDNRKLSAEFAPQEEKTVIYVLSKKDNELTANDFATPAPTVPSKPEVFFIKYKTPEEAEAAQKEIQDQYDQLGGTKEFSDEGTAPVASVIGSLDGIAPDGSYNYRAIAAPPEELGSASSPLSQYLPAAARL
ncbi:uncharacterized protein LOC126760012 [Bactrocera neohumeralis]|uniref:Uncharacterized protein LOC105227470 n=1 Tax=Bactrocera dorsalis TaxID=27457 RepID=A0A034W1H8_BACDO|nr:uncharacterized protein LOC105227470 [Bactrocera dorsalis]XP_039959094.1 uncharacterized protein LOC120773944 [Bactrocera tryoni]XP_050331287.1 uncharacterized protein LOC126760012 [Bactrocera neohumeralis]